MTTEGAVRICEWCYGETAFNPARANDALVVDASFSLAKSITKYRRHTDPNGGYDQNEKNGIKH